MASPFFARQAPLTTKCRAENDGLGRINGTLGETGLVMDAKQTLSPYHMQIVRLAE